MKRSPGEGEDRKYGGTDKTTRHQALQLNLNFKGKTWINCSFAEKVRDECLESIKYSRDEKELEIVGQLTKLNSKKYLL